MFILFLSPLQHLPMFRMLNEMTQYIACLLYKFFNLIYLCFLISFIFIPIFSSFIFGFLNITFYFSDLSHSVFY